jgi:hypothetical protein
MNQYQPATLTELVATSVPDTPISAQFLIDYGMPATLAELVAESEPDVLSGLVLRGYPSQNGAPAHVGFTQRRMSEGKCVLGRYWRISD